MAGVDCLVLCDTNGGSLPFDIERIVGDVRAHFPGARSIGIHLHNDTGCGVANALAAVRAGANQVQGTINGYGERVGNCDLVPIIANLSLKMGVQTLPEGRLERLTKVSHHIAEIVNFTVDPQQPYVGSSAFAHKAGLHTSAISRRKDAYEHIDPALVGNGTRFLVSEMSGEVHLRAEGDRARPRDRRQGAGRRRRPAEASRARGLPLRGRRRVARTAHAPRRRVAAGLLHARVVQGARAAPHGW